MSDDELDGEFAEVWFYAHPCDCGSRSWAFPVLVDVVDNDSGVSAHWRDGVGWELCDLDPEVFGTLSSVPGSPSYEEYLELGLHKVALANELPLEHWLPLWQTYLDRQLADAENLLETAERIVVKERNRRRIAECRCVVSRIEDSDLAASAHRLLAQDWAGTPAELLSTAAAVMSSRAPQWKSGPAGAPAPDARSPSRLESKPSRFA